MDFLTLEDLRAVDEASLLFSPWGLGRLEGVDDETFARWHQDAIAGIELRAEVPDNTRAAYERVRLVHTYGILCYDLYTVADSISRFVLELALRERLISWFDGELTLTKAERLHVIHADCWATVRVAFEAGGPCRRDWNLVCSDGQLVPFRGTLNNLMDWARAERLLPGEHERLRQDAFVALRNYEAHPEGTHLVGPPQSAQAIQSIGVLINGLYQPPPRPV